MNDLELICGNCLENLEALNSMCLPITKALSFSFSKGTELMMETMGRVYKRLQLGDSISYWKIGSSGRCFES